MQNLDGKQYVDGKLKNTVDVTIYHDGHIVIRGYVFFCSMILNSIVCPINVQTQKGENVKIVKTFIEDQEFIQITIDDEEPIYCNPFEFSVEVKDSFARQLA